MTNSPKNTPIRHKSLNHVLIPNRSEIACRIAKTACEKLGIKVSILFQESHECIDANKPQVLKMASYATKGQLISLEHENEAFDSTAASQESNSLYLNQELIVHIAKKYHCDAIHPGFGFLSENPTFARKVQEEPSLTWIGPSPEAIEKMGSKQLSKQILQRYNDNLQNTSSKLRPIPLIPGYNGEKQDADSLFTEMTRIGLPCLLKAAAGGGGKGMRVVQDEKDFLNALDSAQKEALSSFGDKRIILEKYLQAVKHVEIQIVGDKYGNVIHAFERDCTVQRRHQKLIEESPSSIMTEELRQKMTQTAIQIAKLIAYEGCGTVEFVVDDQLNYYFLEVNTRLQVEHPVTEFICEGHTVDLVEWQIRIAEGFSIPELLRQHEHQAFGQQKEPYGHSIEVRVCAEDAFNNFQPSPGQVLAWCPNYGSTYSEFAVGTETTCGVRVDSGVESGSIIPLQYDPMVAKVIVWGRNRAEAIRKMIRVLQSTVCFGINTNMEYIIETLRNSVFQEGTFLYTSFLNQYHDSLLKKVEANRDEHRTMMLQAASLYSYRMNRNKQRFLRHVPSGWTNRQGRSQKQQRFFMDQSSTGRKLGIPDEIYSVEYSALGNGTLEFSEGKKMVLQNVRLLKQTSNSPVALHELSVLVDGVQTSILICRHRRVEGMQDREILYCKHMESGAEFAFSKHSPLELCSQKAAAQSTNFDEYKAQMPSEITCVPLDTGAKVSKGDVLLSMESMKMETKVTAWKDGTVEYFVVQGDRVGSGDRLLTLKDE